MISHIEKLEPVVLVCWADSDWLEAIEAAMKPLDPLLAPRNIVQFWAK